VETLSPSYKQYVTVRAGQTVRVPVSRGRGLSATPGADGSYRVIGDPLAPDATRYVTNNGAVIIWLPWPQLQDPSRAQLVALLSAAPSRLYLVNAGPTQLVVLPSEGVTVGASAANFSPAQASANLVWSITDSSGSPVAQLTNSLTIAAGQTLAVAPTDVGQLPAGDYTITANLVSGAAQLDSIQSLVRVLDPTVAVQPSERIVVSNGTFSTAGGKRVFLQGVNYWPRYVAGVEPAAFAQSWLAPQNYDPDVVEADLTELASLHFNLVSLQYAIQPPMTDEARSLIDFLDRCRKHGIWANIAFLPLMPNTNPPLLEYDGELLGLNPNIASTLQSAYLPGNDRVFAYDMLWEPGLSNQAARAAIDGAWRTWLTQQYGSTSNAQSAWGFSAPLDSQGQVSNPLDTQFQNDGAWRVMVAAYRRFADDYLGHGLAVGARAIQAVAPGTLLSFRNGSGTWSVYNNQFMGYDLGVAAAHVDFVSSELYGCCAGNGGVSALAWPDSRGYGFGAAYGHYRAAGKPVYWAEYGFNIGFTPTPATLASQAATADAMMRIVNEDGSAASSVWWMPGGWRSDSGDDYGILNPDGSPRSSATTLAQWGATFAAAPPTQTGTPVTLTVDRDGDARGQYGLFVNFQTQYVQAKQAGSPVVLKDAGTGTDTSSMPLVQIGNVPFTGTGPLKYANGEFAGIHMQCPAVDVQVENGASVQVTAGSACQLTPTLVNTGSASWLAASQPQGGVLLHTSAGDLPIQSTLPYLQRVSVGPLKVSVGQSNINITGRLNAQGVGTFGETLNLTLVSGPGVAPPPALALSTSSLPNGVVELAYSQPLAASGGTAPYSWSLSKGTLPPGLQIQSSSGIISGTLTTVGTFTFTVELNDSGSQSATHEFTINVGGSGLVNTASYLPAVARGALTSIFGSGLASETASSSGAPLAKILAGTQVMVNGIAAPLFFVSANQVNFQIPFETPLNQNVAVVVERGGIVIQAATAVVVEYAPGILTYQRTPQIVDPIIRHGNGNLVSPSDPAVANEELVAYGTGIGALSNPPATGAASPSKPPATALLTPTITVGGAAAISIFAGLSPGFVGLAQFNFQLPAKLPAGSSLPLTIEFGNASSQVVNLAVH
jgi:uncharacterized protein (TIGR03437 family)